MADLGAIGWGTLGSQLQPAPYKLAGTTVKNGAPVYRVLEIQTLTTEAGPGVIERIAISRGAWSVACSTNAPRIVTAIDPTNAEAPLVFDLVVPVAAG